MGTALPALLLVVMLAVPAAVLLPRDESGPRAPLSWAGGTELRGLTGSGGSGPRYVAAWTVAPAGPSARFDPAVAFDPSLNATILFGGAYCITQGSCGSLGDTWELRQGVWTNLTADLAVAPSPRAFAGMGWDPVSHDLVLFGGGGAGSDFNDTWAFSGTSWELLDTPVAPPPLDSMSFVPMGNGTFLLFGGRIDLAPNRPATDSGQTWELVNDSWVNRTSNYSGAPDPRFQAAATYDPSRDQALVFGGWDATVLGRDDTWTFSWSGGWRSLPTANVPPGRVDASFAYDPFLGADVLYGGRNSGGLLSDTWYLAGGAWYDESQSPADPPGPLVGGAAWYDGASDLLDLFGGSASWLETDTGAAWMLPPTLGGTIDLRSSSVETGEPVGFSASSVRAIPGYPVTFAWAFGDGQHGLGIPQVHEYSAPGIYEVTLWTNDSLGRSNETNATLTLLPRLTLPVILSAPASVTPGATWSVTSAPSGGIPPYTYAYSGLPLGCLSVDAPSLSCRPTETGAFTIVLTVMDSAGLTAEARTNLTVGSPAVEVEAFWAQPDPVPTGDSTTLRLVLGPAPGAVVVAYTGLPPGCASSNTTQLTCTPSRPGNYTVNVTVHLPGGPEANRSLALEVSTSPSTSPTTSPALLLGAGVGAGAAGGALGVWALLRRRRSVPSEETPSTDPAPWSEESSTDPEPAVGGEETATPSEPLPDDPS
jgi:hypothetical protein